MEDYKKKNPLSSSIRQAMFDKYKQFCRHCTIHGVYYFYNSGHWWTRLTWCCVLAVSAALCGFLCHMIWDKFMDDPTFTVVESTRYPVENIPFPAVSVCDPETAYRPNSGNVTDLLRLRGYNITQIEDFYLSFTNIKNKGYKPEAYIKKMHVTLRDLGYTYVGLLEQLKKPCEVILHHCAWRSKVFNCSDMFRQVFTLVGYCCQFDLTYFRRHAHNDTNFLSGVEITEGLEVSVNSGRRRDGHTLLYVFDELDELTLLDSPITMTSSTYFDVTLVVWTIESSPDVSALSVRNRKCYLKSDHDMNSYQECITNLMMKTVVEACRCLPFKYKSEDLGLQGLAQCQWHQLACIYENIGRVQSGIRSVIAEEKCYQKCDYVQYSTEVEYVKQGRDEGNRSKRYSRVTVHFSDDTCMKYRREVLYTWDQMLANLGGIFGLCLGGSIISVIEILWFLLQLLYAVIAVVLEKIISRQRKRNWKVKKIASIPKVKTRTVFVIGSHRFVN